MRKKLTSLILCAIMMFTMSACGPKVNEKALDALEEVIKNVVDMKAADYTIGINGKVDEEETNTSVHGSYNFMHAKPKFSADVSMKQGEKELNDYMGFYIDSDMAYMRLSDLVKSKNSISAIVDSADFANLILKKDDFKLPKEDLKKVLTKASLNGDTISLEFDCKKLEEMIKEDEKDSIAVSSLVETVSLEELSVDINRKDKMLSSANFKVKATSSDDTSKEKQTADIKINLTFKNVNKDNKVVFPDFSDYKENKSSSAITNQ